MSELIKANVAAGLTYFRRSKLLLAFMLIFLLLTGLQSLPPIFMNSGVQSFNSLRQVISTLEGFLLVLAAGMGLLIISSHLRNRSLKMVFTKPCRPALWLLSAFLSATLVSLFLNAVVLTGGIVLSLMWHLPVRFGLVFVSAQTFAISLGLISYLMLLATVMHPALAAIVALIFNADLFYEFQVWTLGAIRSGNNHWALKTLERVFHTFYIALPMLDPFDNKTENIHISLRVLSGEWKYLLFSFGYALALSAFCYCVSLYALQRRNHI
jgi:ABC-type transport system involved in multi-copper enzyme maturation permease subunit